MMYDPDTLEVPPLKFKSGYKYQNHEDYTIHTGIKSAGGGNHFVNITPEGVLFIRLGYAWDGASGPAINTLNFRTGSMVHDAIYQLIREGVLTMEDRHAGDQLLRAIILKKGMWRVRAWWVYHAVDTFGERWMKGRSDAVEVAP